MKRITAMKLALGIAAFALAVAVPPAALVAEETGVNRKTASAERSRALREAMQALEAAKKRNADGSGLENIRRAASTEEAKKLREQASGALKRSLATGGSEELAKRAAQEQVLRQAKASATPEATELIKASAATPPAPPGKAKPVVLVAQNAPPPPKPGGNRGTPTPVNPADVTVPPRVVRDTKTKPEPKEKVVITAEDAAFFDANNRIAIFKGNVEVDHPTFDLSCDTLEVFFKEKQAEEKKTGGEEAEADGDAAQAAGEIDKVVATGKQVVIQKMSAKNQLQIGKCRKAVFHGGSGQVEMLVWPQVQQGKYLIISKEEGTRMIFSQNGEMQTFGETESTFVKDDEKKDKQDPPPGTRPPSLNQ